MRNKSGTMLGLYTRMLWEKDTEKGDIRAGENYNGTSVTTRSPTMLVTVRRQTYQEKGGIEDNVW